jgi:hypothetical protein
MVLSTVVLGAGPSAADEKAIGLRSERLVNAPASVREADFRPLLAS